MDVRDPPTTPSLPPCFPRSIFMMQMNSQQFYHDVEPPQRLKACRHLPSHDRAGDVQVLLFLRLSQVPSPISRTMLLV